MTEERTDSARRLYEAYLVRAHEGLDFESYCAEHPRAAEELRDLHGLFQRASDLSSPRSLSERLEERYGSGADPRVVLPDKEERPESTSGFSSQVLARLSQRRGAYGRYVLKGEIARGGQGAVVRVWDEDLRRSLAMKVLLGKDDGATSGTASADSRSLGRFLEEAQVTGQIDHPGIVPVHELGLDADGRAYFTMKLVRGETLKDVLERVADGSRTWTQTRIVSLLQRVCEAMAYAHHKGVVHRDLKPANVMVGRFGEVYVMDWGLARVLDREDTRDLEIDPESLSLELKSERRELADVDSPLLTMDGDVVGTPAYMPPEQALGRIAEVGPQSDVYGVGAMLYHLLAGHMPYAEPGSRRSKLDIWQLVRSGPPTPIAERAPAAPVELASICERAMAREAQQRYPDMRAMAEDLAAYVERRVVSAYETGALAEAKKWVQRNKALAASLLAAVVLLLVGLLTSLAFKARADENARLALERASDVLSLSTSKDRDDLVERAAGLWPAHPELLEAYEDWLADARALLEGHPADPARGRRARPGLEHHRSKLEELRSRSIPSAQTPGEPRTYAFEDGQDAWWHVQLSQLVSDLEALRDPKTGLLAEDAVSEEHGWSVAKRYAFARTIGERSVTGDEARERWSETIEAIAKSPRYGGLALAPQMGLLPIGADPQSGLFEFAHLQTGEPATRSADGSLAIEEETGLVFVLIPGGSFWMGAQRSDAAGPNYDPLARIDEGPVRKVELSAYFLSKYEMTQGQWLRLTGSNPSYHRPPETESFTLVHPVEQVSWLDCRRVLGRAGLALPSEAQWERGARGGTQTPWWTGDERESLRWRANLADQAARREGADWASLKDWPDLDDGFAVHAPVGTYEANAFGLHEVAGNLWEQCLDGYEGDVGYANLGDDKDPVSPWEGAGTYVTRGGSFLNAASNARVAMRGVSGTATFAEHMLGVRPARLVQPGSSEPAADEE